jgi:lysophospholipase L1-like esterase
MKMTKIALSALLGLLCLAPASFADEKVDAAIKKATTPDDRLKEGAKEGKKGWWDARHEQKLALVKQGGWELVFIGDSITQAWEGPGKATWEKFYGNRKALNLGYSGDRTEHVLWRFEHGELDGLKPKGAIIMIGTNNTGHRNDPPEAIAAGVKAIVEKLRASWPDTKLLVLGIFPRAPLPTTPARVNNDKANELIAKLADGDKVTYLNINEKFLTATGELTKEVMPDLLHPPASGYQTWAEAIEPAVKKLLGE